MTDAFGREANVPRASAVPPVGRCSNLPARDAAGSPDLFVLPPVTAETLQSDPIEDGILI